LHSTKCFLCQKTRHPAKLSSPRTRILESLPEAHARVRWYAQVGAKEQVRRNMATLEAEQTAATTIAQQKEDMNTNTSSGIFFDHEVLLAFVVVFVLCGLSYIAAYWIGVSLRAIRLGSLFIPLVFIDFALWRNLSKPKRHSKYLPFIWWWL
jgi:hypothetical protein